MALFQEIDLTTFSGGYITGIEPASVAAELGLRPGDELLAINGNPVADIIDVQFYTAEETFELTFRRQGKLQTVTARRDYNQTLGLEFSHPTFDTDIRRCNNLCEFCFVLQMAPKFRRTLYIKDDDYRYSFLFGHYVTLTNLSEHDWWRIEHMKLSPLFVSVHVTDLEKRRQYLRNAKAPDILEQLAWLADRDIEVHTQIVVTPGVNDGRLLEKSIRDLEAFWPAVPSISVVPVGLTKHHKYQMRPHTAAEAAATLAFVENLQSEYLAKFGVRLVYPTDEWFLVSKQPVPPLSAYDGHELHENGLGMVRHFLDEWEAVQAEIKNYHLPIDQKREITNLTGVKTAVQPIINERLGDTITVAGLLMAGDVIKQLQTADMGDLLIFPRVMFDHPDTISLDDLTPQDVADRVQRPLALADTMGDIWDALTGQSQVMFTPTP